MEVSQESFERFQATAKVAEETITRLARELEIASKTISEQADTIKRLVSDNMKLVAALDEVTGRNKAPNRAEFWGKKILDADSSGDEKSVRSVMVEASKETKSKTTTSDGVHLWLFVDGSVLRTTPEENGKVGHVQWTKP